MTRQIHFMHGKLFGEWLKLQTCGKHSSLAHWLACFSKSRSYDPRLFSLTLSTAYNIEKYCEVEKHEGTERRNKLNPFSAGILESEALHRVHVHLFVGPDTPGGRHVDAVAFDIGIPSEYYMHMDKGMTLV